MGITNVNSNVASSTVVAVNTQSDITIKDESAISAVKDFDHQQNTGTAADQNQPSEDEFKNVTDELNNFMQSINTDITFALHTETNTLMVQVEDGKTHKVLKEFPAHELLDTVARIRDCVGVFLDKKI